ncbi:MAG TPA: VWA domain-containing protein [Pyrinomonadaceae bacterium]|nr:VWA domain-containing protein [Chloracidobacterium sp.]MBK7801241.1 VWA domain-containing protein [Chloracidobacterium sp.]MBL0241547.1 VWA domain-containing protein [Chloracidobacterium sp.]MBP9109312.1 VWA domain-containing protein [Pyrinomonadaceae bacterium]HQY68721.1 VWA domain-containing protein [Pyrinomonadaceae bacterium]
MKNKTIIEIKTIKEKSTAGEGQTIDVLVRVVPPERNNTESKRPKLNLSVVLDRSGSMGGEKMQYAREAAKYCIDQMLTTDRLSTVIFDQSVDVLIPSQEVRNKAAMRSEIDRIEARGSTALHEAWVRGGLQVSDHLDNDAINRVLLITDGQANVGETNVNTIVHQTRELGNRGISTSTIGIGRDFNEDLLMPMAEAGNGNSWHVQEPDDMQRIFEVELKGLIAQVGHSVTFGIKPKEGVRVVELLNDLERDPSGRYKLPNLQSGSPLEIVVRLAVPTTEAGATLHLADFDLSYIGQDSKLPEKSKAKFQVEFAAAEVVDALEEDPSVAQAVLLLINARARREVAEHIDRGDPRSAKSSLAAAMGATDQMFLRAPSPELRKELNDLAGIDEALDIDDMLARKLGLYQRYNRRTGKE